MIRKMEKVRKYIVLSLAFLLVISMLAGCGADKKDEPEPDTTTEVEQTNSTKSTQIEEDDPLKEKVEISIALWDIGNMKTEGVEDAVRDKIYEKLNITIKPVNITWDDYVQKTQVWAASSQLPDVFAIDAVSTPNFKSWITQDIVHELPADLSPYPNVAEMMEGQDFQAYKYPLGDPNGKFYCIPRPNYRSADLWANDFGVIIRKDWMSNVGVTKEPENMDEFIELMKAFVEKDPDQNNKKDTVGLTGYNTAFLSYIVTSFEPGISSGGVANWIKGSDGKWIPAFLTEDCVEGVNAMKKLFDAGGLDKDFATLKGEEGMDKFAAGKAGAYAHNVLPSTLNYLNDKFVKLNPDKKLEDVITFLKPFKSKDGNMYRNIAPGPWSESYINGKADDVKVDRIMRLFDYLLSDEGFKLIRFGIEGVDYNMQGDEIVMVEQKKADGTPLVNLSEKYPVMYLSLLTEWSGGIQYTSPTIPVAFRKMSKEFLDWQLANCKPVPIDLRHGFMDYPSKAKAVEMFHIDMTKAIMSNDAEKTFRELSENYMKNGYEQVIADFNAKVTEMGMN